MTAPSSQAPTVAPPVRIDEEIVPRIRWVQIGKSNCYLDLDKKQNNPIYKMAEEFTQSIHTFIDDKQNLSQHITGKKRATLIVIPSIRFTKLIIHHLQRRHKFHLRPDSPLHLPNEEPVLGYLKFSPKGSKREVFEMPIPAPTKLQVKKHKQATKTSDKPPTAKKSKHRCVTKIRSLKSMAALEAEEVPTVEPQVTDKDADYQKVLEESMKTAYALPRGPLPPVVIREPESRKYQPLPEVPGKGKAKVTKEHVAHDLLSLQKPKKKSPTEQYIFQRRISEPAGSSHYDDSPYDVLGQSDDEEESEKVVLGATTGGNDEDQAGPDPGAQAEGQAGIDAGTLDEGQAGSNPDKMSEGQAGPDLGNAGDEEQSIPSPVVHAGSDYEHMDLDVANVLPQPFTEQLDEGFTVTVYLKVQENLKLAVEEHVLLEEPASSSGTLFSLQHLSKDICFRDQFFRDKPSDTDKNAETEVESMVNVPIQQAMSSLIIDLTSRPVSPKVHQQFKATTTDTTTTTTTTTLPPPQAQQQSTIEAMMVSIAVSEMVMDAVDWAMQAPLCNRFRDLPKADMKEIIHQRMWETESYKTHKDHKLLFEALEKSMNRDHSEELAQDLTEAHKKKKKSRESPKMPPGSPSHQPPPPPPPAGPSGPSGAPRASRSSQVPPPPSPPPSTSQEVHLEMDEDMGPDEQAQFSDDEDIGSAHIPKASALASNYSPPSEDSLLAQIGDMATFINWFYKRQGITELKPQDLEGPAFEIIKFFHPDVIHLQYQMEECHKLMTDSVDNPILRNNVRKPLPLGGLPGQVTIQFDFFINKHLEYLRYDSNGNRAALSISKIKTTYYPNADLEQMWVFNSPVQLFRALSALRRSGLRTASTAAKPCQGDSSKLYLITGANLQEQGLIIAALRDELKKLKGKSIVDTTVTTHSVDPEMLKVDVESIAPRLLNNRTVYSDYLRLT
nr:hypothetical protein [Tanacetum cinerariifolium]